MYRSRLAISSLILGIIAIALGWMPVIGWLIALVGLGLGIAALVMINQDARLAGRGMAITGVVLSGVAIVLYVVIALALFTLVAGGVVGGLSRMGCPWC